MSSGFSSSEEDWRSTPKYDGEYQDVIKKTTLLFYILFLEASSSSGSRLEKGQHDQPIKSFDKMEQFCTQDN
jgi:hypothetical protein